MKVIIAIFLLVLVVLQYRLWVGEGSIAHKIELEKKIKQQLAENEILEQRNRTLALEVEALKKGTEAIEERAREELGMIKEGETFFMIVEPEDTKDK